VRGLELSHRFYAEAVRPILERRFPRLEHAAALLGSGSEVLGFDDAISTDHHWGPRAQLFVRDLSPADEIYEALANELPVEFAGYPTNFGPPDPDGSRHLVPIDSGPVAHRIDVETVSGFMLEQLGFDPLAGVEIADWLVTPSQRFLSVTGGEVYADAIGDLTAAREALAWYPHDVWLLVMAGQWRRISQLEHFVGRTGLRGDDLGSRLIAARLVDDLMRVAFVQERQYAPYPKWFGSAYALLGRPEQPALEAALAAASWTDREAALSDAYRLVACAHNELGVTAPLDPDVRQFYDRPFQVPDSNRFVDALRAAISDPAVRAIEHQAGSINAVSDNTDVLTRPGLWRTLCGLYAPAEPSSSLKRL
jgi:Domain of unknown function (DUF4037)